MIKHEVDFSTLEDFEWDTAYEIQDTRKDYHEPRWIALGSIKHRLHVLVYTKRLANIRVISLRKANIREIHHYEKTKPHL